jgi:enamine deaminase RidA (YjgF/YER057c/UK114 family)
MKRTAVNPNEWGLAFGINQAEVVEGLSKVLHCSRQTSLVPDPDSEMRISVSHPGDMRGQVQASLHAIDELPDGAGMSRANILSLRFYTTDVDGFLANYDVYADWIGAVGVRPPQTLLGIRRLAMPELLIEIEALAGMSGQPMQL